MKVVVIEDERISADRLISLIERYDPAVQIAARLSSVKESVEWFRSTEASRIDLVFMDIHLEDGDSFQIIDQLNLSIPIIFTTAFDHYMIKAFKVNSVDYLLKPVAYDELQAALDKYQSIHAGKEYHAAGIQKELISLMRQLKGEPQSVFKDRFMITVGTKIRSIGIEQVAYFYLEEKTVFLVTADGATLPIDYSLDKLMQLVDSRAFFRVNRQFIISHRSVNLAQTLSTGRLKLELSPKFKEEILVSVDKVTAFKEWLGKD